MECPQDPVQYWRAFERVAACYPNVLKLVIQLAQCSTNTSHSLRGASRAMREAVNRSVTTVRCDRGVSLHGADLAEVFPEAEHLLVSMQHPTDSGTKTCAELERPAIWLEHVAASSPVLLGQVESLELDLSVAYNAAEDFRSISELLPRCTTLQRAELIVGAARARFTGAGNTPAERQSSLLHAMLSTLKGHTCSSLQVLEPSSWPTCSYLTSLQLGGGYEYCTYAEELHAALQATSLVALEVAARNNDELASLSGVSSLTRLTSLGISSEHTESLDGDAGSQVAASIARVSTLRQLSIRCTRQQHHAHNETSEGSPQHDAGPGDLHIPCWAHLTRLTSLSLTSRRVDLRQLAMLQQLQHLDVQGSPVCAGSLASLFPLTRLTSLSSGNCKARFNRRPLPAVYTTQPGRSSLQEVVVVPAAWREGLRVLRWGCGDSALTPALLSQLTSLVELHVHGLVVTPEACMALCSLQRITQLDISDAAPPEDVPHPARPDSHPTRSPMLRGLGSQLTLTGHSYSVFHALACCTVIPAPVKLWTDYGLINIGYLAVKRYSLNWLLSMFAAQKSSWTAAVLVDDADVDLYVAALESSEPLWVSHLQDGYWPRRYTDVCLGVAVTPAGLGRLLRSKQLPDKKLTFCRPPDEWEVQGPPAHVLDWTAGLALTSQLLARVPRRADRAASALRVLCVHGCELLGDGGLAALAALAPQLHWLRLWNARRVGDAGLAALAKGCRKLTSVVLSDALRVTAAGVVWLIEERFDEVELGGLGLGRATALRGDVLQMLAARGPGDSLQRQWVVKLGSRWDGDTRHEVFHALRVVDIV